MFKKRVGVAGRGKCGGLRTLLAFRMGDQAYFVFGYAKNQRANVSEAKLQVLKLMAVQLLCYDTEALELALLTGELFEVERNE